MNINKNSKIQPDISPQTKSFLIISSYYQIDTLYHILKSNPNLINTKDQKKETLLSYAIKRKNIENAELILTSPLLDYSFQDKNGNSYLHLAIINQLENIVRTLIQKGINLNIQNNDGNTALHFAYSTGDIKFITIMIENKVDFAIKNKNGLIAEEIAPGTFPEILDINNNNNLNNKMNVIHNKNNTVTINLNLNNVNNNSKEIEKDNNTLINERGQINKSIKIDWEGNCTKAKINNNINTLNENQNKLDNTSKTKLKYSLVDFSYSDDDGEGEEKENGIIINKSSSKQQNNCEKNNRKDIKSSDIFDLASSLNYQQKVANASEINAHVVGEPTNLINEYNIDLGNNDDIVNINNIKNSLNKPNLTSNDNVINNLINNEISMSQVSFQTAYENGRNINISQVENGKRMKSDDFRKENIIKENGQSINFDNYSSYHKKEEYNNYNNGNLNKNESLGVSNYRNSSINQSNEFRPQIDFNQDFAFSPFTTLKEPLNRKSNGSEVNVNNSNKINNLNNYNLGVSNNININNEIDSNNKKINENIYNYNINNNSKSSSLKRSNALNDKSLNNSNINVSINNINNLSLSESNNINHNKNIKSNPNFNKNNGSIYTDLSKVSQNNMNLKTNSKIDFNCPISLSQETLTDSISISRNPLYKFLAEIKMEKYYEIMNSNGFDDIQLLINQTKSGSAIDDKQLKEAGINFPGDRAKILIHLQEKAGNFIFPIPKEVYYICQSENYKNDRNINKLNEWLKALKIENYLEGFIKNGYHSVELMLLQMESKNPLTDEILKDEIGISKIGHRSRIINKLIEEGKSLNNKLKATMLVVGNAMSEKICDCTIF